MEKIWSKEFLQYMEFIKNHPNYKGLPIERKSDGSLAWIATAQSEVGKKRKEWALKKAKELNIPDGPGVYAKVMFAIHPTKEKVCQVCGKSMSLYYVYPNANLVKSIKKNFEFQCDTITSIYDVCHKLCKTKSEESVKRFLIKTFKVNISQTLPLDSIIAKCELQCRDGSSKLMGPGAMSNFPDRADGFHTYNRCCRSKEDKGRSKENLKSYGKDRRAYEYWSDGNIHAANQFMHSSFFDRTSADHVGPISLGFIHDSLNLQKMSSGDNSSKRDRLQYEDIEKVCAIEKKNNVCCMSWYSQDIWKYIKQNYQNHPELLEQFWNILKTNRHNFMLALWIISTNSGLGNGFLIDSFLKPNLGNFKYDYVFNDEGQIISKTLRNITDATKKESGRYYRIAIDSISEYHEKENRNLKDSFSQGQIKELITIAKGLNQSNFASSKKQFMSIINLAENELLSSL